MLSFARGCVRAGVVPLAGCIFALFTALPLIALLTHVAWSSVFTVLGNSLLQSAVQVSLISTTVATSITAVLGIPLGYVLASYRFPGRSILTGLVYIPLVLPPLIAGVLLELVWGQSGTVEQFLQPHGVFFGEQLAGIVLCQIFVSSPFIVIASRSAFERIDKDLDESARTMGADTLAVFWSIALPLSARSILAGVALSWMRSFGEFGATSIMAYHPFSFPTYVYNFIDIVPFSQIYVMSLLALAMCALVLLVTAALERVGVISIVIERLTQTRVNPVRR